jgi:hypothetical protein
LILAQKVKLASVEVVPQTLSQAFIYAWTEQVCNDKSVLILSLVVCVRAWDAIATCKSFIVPVKYDTGERKSAKLIGLGVGCVIMLKSLYVSGQQPTSQKSTLSHHDQTPSIMITSLMFNRYITTDQRYSKLLGNKFYIWSTAQNCRRTFVKGICVDYRPC